MNANLALDLIGQLNFNFLMKQLFQALITIMGFSTTSYALDCRQECASDQSESECIHFGFPVKHSVKSLLDIANHFSPSPVPNVSYSPCKRSLSISDSAFESKGQVCREYTVFIGQEPGDPVDPNNQIYVRLPAIMAGQYISASQKIVFSGSDEKPIFEATSQGNVWTSGTIDSVFFLNLGSDTELVLETANMCYSVLVQL